MRHGMERPEQFARDRVKSPDILFKSGHNDDVTENRRGRCRRAEAPLQSAGQFGFSSVAETCNGLAGFGSQGVQELPRAEKDAFRRAFRAAPINETAKGRPAFRLKSPDFHA